jgi:hypothetical protein
VCDVQHQPQDVAPCGLVQFGRELVSEDDPRPHGQRPRHGDPLLLSAGELLDEVIRIRRETDLGERRGRAFAHLVPGSGPAWSGTSTFSVAVSRLARP